MRSLAGGDMLPDLFSDSSVFDAGNFDNVGYTAAFTQNLGDTSRATVIYGNEGALDRRARGTGQRQSGRVARHDSRRPAPRGHRPRHGHLPRTGTHLIASYQWTGDSRWAMAGNLYSTQAFRPMPGLNIYFRQPIPGFCGTAWKLRPICATCWRRAISPIAPPNGAQLLLVDNPRSIRGGLAFIF